MYFIGVLSLCDNVFKVIICGFFLFVDDFVVLEMLYFFDVMIKSDFKYENIRYLMICWMISVLNGNRFIYIVFFFNNKLFFKSVICVKLKCCIYYYN